MTRTFFAVAALATLVAAPAFATENANVRTVVRDGQSYSYTTTEKNGVTILQGVGLNRNLHLEVRGDKVTGTVDGARVSFNVSDMEALADEIGPR